MTTLAVRPGSAGHTRGALAAEQGRVTLVRKRYLGGAVRNPTGTALGTSVPSGTTLLPITDTADFTLGEGPTGTVAATGGWAAMFPSLRKADKLE